MDWDEIERNWTELKGEVKHRWSKLTEEDVDFVNGKYAELLGLLPECYGHAKEQAEQEINDCAERLRVDIVAHGVYRQAEISDARFDSQTARDRNSGSRAGSPGAFALRHAVAAGPPT